jgi:hypothetical protein
MNESPAASYFTNEPADPVFVGWNERLSGKGSDPLPQQIQGAPLVEKIHAKSGGLTPFRTASERSCGPFARTPMSTPVLGLLEPEKTSRSATRKRLDQYPPITRPPLKGLVLTFWPVLAGTGIALLIVGVGLALAINILRKPASPVVIAPEPGSMRVVAQPPLAKPAAPPASPRPAPKSVPSAAEPVPPPSPIPANSPPEAAPGQLKLLDEIDLPPLPIAPPRDEQPVLPNFETHGTAVNFVRSPQVANRQAQLEDKLVFILHVSGNFEDPGFT